MRDAVETDTLGENDFYILSYLMSREELSLKDVAVICLSLFSDGLSTTTPTVLFCLYCLATNPKIQEKARKEIDNVVGADKYRPLTAEDLGKMPYLRAFIKETFRFAIILSF